jgi:hypothetical protein
MVIGCDEVSPSPSLGRWGLVLVLRALVGCHRTCGCRVLGGRIDSTVDVLCNYSKITATVMEIYLNLRTRWSNMMPPQDGNSIYAVQVVWKFVFGRI